MYLQFENDELIDNDFPNNKAGNGSRWFTRSQMCLMFLDGSKWPEKFELNLSFSSSKEDQQSVSAISVGKYELSESAYGFDNRRNPTVDFTKLKPLADQDYQTVLSDSEIKPESKKPLFQKKST